MRGSPWPKALGDRIRTILIKITSELYGSNPPGARQEWPKMSEAGRWVRQGAPGCEAQPPPRTPRQLPLPPSGPSTQLEHTEICSCSACKKTRPNTQVLNCSFVLVTKR